MEDLIHFSVKLESIPHPPDSEAAQQNEFYFKYKLNGKKFYSCTHPHCGKTFRFKSEADRHIIIHQKDRPYRCRFDHCNKTFKRPESLREHVKIHSGDLIFSCDKPGCEKSYVSRSALRYHLLKHSDNRVFKCDVEGCDKSFITISQLRQHKKSSSPRIHSIGSNFDKEESEVHKIPLSDHSHTPTEIVVDNEKNSKEKSQDKCKALLHRLLLENNILKETLCRFTKYQEFSENKG